MIAVDTNLLVYAHRSGLPEHRQAQRAVEKACGNPTGWAIPVFCAAEFWAVVTHRFRLPPAIAGRGGAGLPGRVVRSRRESTVSP